MQPTVRIRTADGVAHTLSPGDLIGRVRSAALLIDDARVSEAHALVSLRGQSLKLLALRGVFAVDGKPLAEVDLKPGLRVLLAPGVALDIEAVALPASVLAIEGDGLVRTLLSGVSSLTLSPRPNLVPRYVEGAAAHLWSTGDSWRLRLAQGQPRDLEGGDEFSIENRRFMAISVALSRAAQAATVLGGGVDRPLSITARYDTVHIHQEGQPHLVLNGISARILSELVAIAAPVDWELLAREVWRDEDERNFLRRKWDVSLVRLRRKLKEGHVRSDLVHSDGAGNIELLLGPGDVVIDES